MTRSIRSRYQELPPDLPPDNDGSPSGFKLAGSLGLALLVLAMGGLGIWWMMSDFSGEYYAQDPNLGAVTIDLTRRPTSIDGTISIAGGEMLDIVSGHVSNNQIELAFAPKAEENAERYITASFQGQIDPPRVEQSSTTISFDQALRPFTGKDSEQNASFTVPRMDVQGKLIKGQLTYHGTAYELTLVRNSLTSMFHWLKSFWPGGR